MKRLALAMALFGAMTFTACSSDSSSSTSGSSGSTGTSSTTGSSTSGSSGGNGSTGSVSAACTHCGKLDTCCNQEKAINAADGGDANYATDSSCENTAGRVTSCNGDSSDIQGDADSTCAELLSQQDLSLAACQ